MRRRFIGVHSGRTVIRPPLMLSDWQETHLRRMAETLSLKDRERFHSHVRELLVGVPGDGELNTAAKRVARAIRSGAKLANKRA
jgi:hypothetical protein